MGDGTARTAWNDGLTRRAWRRSALWAGVVFLAGVGLIAWFVAYITWLGDHVYWLARNGISTVGTVTEDPPSRLRCGQVPVGISFAVGLRKETHTFYVDGCGGDGLHKGDTVWVDYDPDNPGDFTVDGRAIERPLPHMLTMISVVAGPVLAVVGLARVRRLHTYRRVATGRGRPRRAWRSFELVDGRLWHGRPKRLPRRHGVRFDPEALVVVDRAGNETAHRWDHHEKAPAPPPQRTWSVRGEAAGGNKSARVSLVVNRESGRDGHSQRLAGRIGHQLCWNELPLLCDYLAATARARAGLTDPMRTAALLRDLDAQVWRLPRPPGEPLLGDRLDIYVAISRVLRERCRHFGDRMVSGDPIPSVDEAVDEAIARLPTWTRGRVDRSAVKSAAERHLAAGRWPFGVLLPAQSERVAPTVV